MSPARDLRHDDLSQLLARWTNGDQEALKSLIPLVYTELRRLAHYRLRHEHHKQTLETTALVHEAYVRLAENPPNKLADRKHFLALAASIMRQVLVDHAREKQAQKRHGGIQIELDSKIAPVAERVIDFLALNEALSSLSKLDPRQATIVELRFFAGLSIEDTSEVLGMSPATVKRDWLTARAWLFQQMTIAAQANAAGARNAE
ncbi:MAG TPA: sigma-70 family RNA polymerase sigma factor [Terriglobales bacterium]|nr:sigma-70 family RNA polymerase sigma factor [Terriglobales bacterium]